MADKLNQVAQVIRENLTDDLRRKPWKGSSDPLAGHCYVASEALYHLIGRRLGFRPRFLYHEGSPHWFLSNNKTVIDLTVGQFKKIPNYSQGVGKGFLTSKPSKRARKLIKAVEKNLKL